mgnify:CR=1 FL=1|jgi:predicted transcriptional regulator YdeE
MAYQLKEVTIRTNNTEEGMKKINELWQDVMNGNLPVLYNNEHTFVPGISPVSRYSNYAGDHTGDYDLSIIGADSEFLEELEKGVRKGIYKKYHESDDNGDVGLCTQKAWGKVWSDDVKRAFAEDYESSVPAEFSGDGKAYCYLYISIK